MVRESVCETGHKLAVFVLSYTLAPHAQYPCQLRQGLEALRFVIETGHRNPSDVIIGGDSAGANLVLGILSFFSHPDRDIWSGPDLPKPLLGAVMLCPWVSFDQGWDSMERNKHKDCLTLKPTTINQKYFLGSRERDNYNEPINAPLEWWRGMRVKRMLVIAGEEEIMVDSQRMFGERLIVRPVPVRICYFRH